MFKCTGPTVKYCLRPIYIYCSARNLSALQWTSISNTPRYCCILYCHVCTDKTCCTPMHCGFTQLKVWMKRQWTMHHFYIPRLSCQEFWPITKPPLFLWNGGGLVNDFDHFMTDSFLSIYSQKFLSHFCKLHSIDEEKNKHTLCTANGRLRTAHYTLL